MSVSSVIGILVFFCTHHISRVKLHDYFIALRANKWEGQQLSIYVTSAETVVFPGRFTVIRMFDVRMDRQTLSANAATELTSH